MQDTRSEWSVLPHYQSLAIDIRNYKTIANLREFGRFLTLPESDGRKPCLLVIRGRNDQIVPGSPSCSGMYATLWSELRRTCW